MLLQKMAAQDSVSKVQWEWYSSLGYIDSLLLFHCNYISVLYHLPCYVYPVMCKR